jgi:uncharacterized protein with HEPN domain
MRPDEQDAAYLWDMLDAAQSIRDFIANVRIHDYLQNRMMQLAIERSIEIIGEAAKSVSREFKQAHPEIPWQGIISQRNVIAHEYGEIKQEKIWAIAALRVPELINKLEPLVPPLPPNIEE